MKKVDIRVSLQPTEVFLHALIFLKVYKKKDKLIDNVKMAGNLVIGVTAVPIIIKEKRKQLRKRSRILEKLHFWVTLQPTEIFLQPHFFKV